MQLLNPISSSRTKVYHDPTALETASLGVAGFKVAGGRAKSYYISKDGEMAYQFRKKDYKKAFDNLLGDCDAVQSNYSKKSWSDFEAAVFEYHTACQE